MPRRKAPKLQLSRLPNCRFGFPHPQTGFDVTFAEGQAMLMNSVTRKHEMDGSVSQSLLIATGGIKNIQLIIDLPEETLQDLHYLKTSCNENTTSNPPLTRCDLG